MQTDPIGYDDGMNMYAYVDNDPVNLNDPTGKWMAQALAAILGGGLEIKTFSVRPHKKGLVILRNTVWAPRLLPPAHCSAQALPSSSNAQ